MFRRLREFRWLVTGPDYDATDADRKTLGYWWCLIKFAFRWCIIEGRTSDEANAIW